MTLTSVEQPRVIGFHELAKDKVFVSAKAAPDWVN